MKDFKVAEARARFGELLDQAEAGESVFIERRGVRYPLEADRPSSRAPARNQFFASIPSRRALRRVDLELEQA